MPDSKVSAGYPVHVCCIVSVEYRHPSTKGFLAPSELTSGPQETGALWHVSDRHALFSVAFFFLTLEHGRPTLGHSHRLHVLQVNKLKPGMLLKVLIKVINSMTCTLT